MSKSTKPKILIFSDFYLPGYKSGGGMRTIVNMVKRLNSRYDFWIITRDHDGVLDTEQYKNVKINEWNCVENARVFYLSKNNIKISKLREIIKKVKPDLLYANSYFSTLSIFVANLRRYKLIPNKNFVIAPCGELSEGSLQNKTLKKNSFIKFSKLVNLHRDIIWKASSEIEEKEISEIKGSGGKIFISPDLPQTTMLENFSVEDKPLKEKGKAKMVFLSRLSRKKNLKWLLENLNGIKGELLIDVIGPLEDLEYWEECKEVINKLPANITIKALGSIPHKEIFEKLVQYHFFILPTLSENFGHVFLEALSAGNPLVISDRTPWLNLPEKGIGWDLSLEKGDEWVETINHCIKMNKDEYLKSSSKARTFVVNWLSDGKVEEDTIKLLDYSLN